MKKYICLNCDDLECETSICPVCGKRTVLKKKSVYWSKKDNVPVLDLDSNLNKDNFWRIGSDIRPVFPEERLLIEIILGAPMVFADKSVWSVGSNKYIVDGKTVAIPTNSELKKIPTDFLLENLSKYEALNRRYIEEPNIYFEKFISLNFERLSLITDEAIHYIRATTDGIPNDEIFVSFSGGKDSTVTSDLVMRAMESDKILHIYGDTTLEYPDSYEYLKNFRNAHPNTPVLTAKNMEQDFLSLCKLIGPPSRVIRWCCTIFKTGAITEKIEALYKDKKRIISFQGIRRNESKSRSKYERETESPKIAKQLVASPIIDWSEGDIWLYVLGNELDINNAYRKGFRRVGCWCCPNNSDWSEFLASIYLRTASEEFKSFLYEFAEDIGKPDWKRYVDSGKWKARQGGEGVESSKNIVLSYKPCAIEENAFNFELTRPISEDLYTLFLPFGILDFSIGRKRLNEVYVLDRKTKNPILNVKSLKIGTNVRLIRSFGTMPKTVGCSLYKGHPFHFVLA